ncbi:formin-like protein 21b isoform X2 [Arachis hypogaea]|uniref:formin-like protein 21b isoform X2 n=1 Tax=Arachis hypogaea TaxID=3818 RepID=UPI000DEC9F6D|nr:formin-like protein 21b isoform X2 [Arachis hypogaea]
MPLPDMMAAVLAMDESVLDVDQVENLIKFCPTKEEMELLKGYTGDKENLGKCEQYFFIADEGATSRVKVRSILFQDSISVSGMVVLAIFFFMFDSVMLFSFCRLQNLRRV